MDIKLEPGDKNDKIVVKLLNRAVYGFLLSCSAIPLVAFSHLWNLFAMSIGLTVLSSTLLGVFNPCRNARDEETLVGSLSFLLTLFLI